MKSKLNSDKFGEVKYSELYNINGGVASTVIMLTVNTTKFVYEIGYAIGKAIAHMTHW